MRTLSLALRQLLRRPGYALLAVLTLALAVGANTAIFSAVNSVLLRSLPYADADRLVRVFETVPDGSRNSVSGGAFKDWQAGSTAFEALAIWEGKRLAFGGQGRPEAVPGIDATADYLAVLGLRPALGRGFGPGDDRADADHRRLVISHGLWMDRFGGDPGVIGRSVPVDQEPHEVVGVLAPGAVLDGGARFLRPLLIDADPDAWARAGHWRHVVARLAPGVTTQMAETELRGIRERLAELYPAFKKDWGVAVLPMRDALVGPMRSVMLILAATAGLVLLIACANLAGLMLLRSLARSGELALRSALGAGRGPLLRETLAEALLLSLAGAAAGLLLAIAGTRLLAGFTAGYLHAALTPALHAEVFVVSLLLALASGFAAALLPALRASRPNPARAMGSGARETAGRQASRTRVVLLAAQTAFTVMLLIGAGLMLRSFSALVDADPGFVPEQTFAFDLAFPAAAYPEAANRNAAIEAIRARLAKVPGVQAVASSTSLPLSRWGISELAHRADQPQDPSYAVGTEYVSGDLLGALGMRLLRGRALAPADGEEGAAPVLLVNRKLADDLFPGEDPVGQELVAASGQWRIVGVVESVRHQAMHLPPAPMLYAPQRWSHYSASVLVRGGTGQAALAAAAREAVAAVDPELPLVRPRSLVDDLERALAVQSSLLQLIGLFALLALVLAAVGLYGALAFSVRQRRRELGVRAALGAGRGRLLALVLAGGLRPCLLGSAAGVLMALALAGMLQGQLYGIDARDPLSFALAVGLMLLVAMLALALPGRQAARTAPAEVLRGD